MITEAQLIGSLRRALDRAYGGDWPDELIINLADFLADAVCRDFAPDENPPAPADPANMPGAIAATSPLPATRRQLATRWLRSVHS